MVTLDKIYTRGGDHGETSLVGGSRIRKNSRRVNAFGDLDELNCHLGVCRTLADKHKLTQLSERLARIQQELFDLGALLATPPNYTWPGMKEIEPQSITDFEAWIDEMTGMVPPLKSFVLPGGNELNATLHVARSVCRRAERSTLSLAEKEPIPEQALVYLNRLSDLLFSMARYAALAGSVKEYLWQSGIKAEKKRENLRRGMKKAQ